MTVIKAMREREIYPLAGSIKNQYLLLLFGSVVVVLLTIASLAVNAINMLGKTALDIDKMAAVESAVMNEIREAIDQSLRTFIFLRVIPASILLLVVIFVIGIFWINWVLRPIKKIIESSQSIAQERSADFPDEAPGEVGHLARELQAMVEHLRLRQEILENHNIQLIQAKEKALAQLVAFAHLAREITIVHQLENFLTRAVNLIKDRFGFYHVAIFILDPSGQYVLLRAATGEAGQKMLAMKHRLKVSQTSVVGYAASTGLLRAVPDIEGEASYFRNPLLPETRSEFAFPLHINQRTIGVLDIQKKETGELLEEDGMVLQAMADLIAAVIDKAHWIKEYQDTYRSLDTLRGRGEREKNWAWMPSRKVKGFTYDIAGVRPVDSEQEFAEEEAVTGKLLSLPLSVRGEVIATLRMWSEKESLSTQEEYLVQEILSRLSQAIESSQLFGDSQIRVRREQMLNQFVSSLSKSMDLDALLQQAVKELSRMPNVNEVSIMIKPAGEQAFEKTPDEPGSR